MIDRDAPDPHLSILPYQDPARPNAFTVEFEERALLLYQVMKDQPVIKLVDAVWG